MTQPREQDVRAVNLADNEGRVHMHYLEQFREGEWVKIGTVTRHMSQLDLLALREKS